MSSQNKIKSASLESAGPNCLLAAPTVAGCYLL